MRRLGSALEARLRAKRFELVPFRSSESRTETTCLLIDPCRSADLKSLGEVHGEFVIAEFK
jgi:hypothetical protein